MGSGGRVPPSTVIENDATGDVETSGTFDPANDGIDFWESLEGMRVQINDAAVVGPSSRFGEIAVVPVGRSVRTARGGIVLQAADANPERVSSLDDAVAPVPRANVGDTLRRRHRRRARLQLRQLQAAAHRLADGAQRRPRSGRPRAARPAQLSVATFNVENLAPTDPQTKFDALAQ